MSRDLLTAAAILVGFGLLWMFVNIKTHSSPARVISYLLMWVSFLAATVIAVRVVWGLLS